MSDLNVTPAADATATADAAAPAPVAEGSSSSVAPATGDVVVDSTTTPTTEPATSVAPVTQDNLPSSDSSAPAESPTPSSSPETSSSSTAPSPDPVSTTSASADTPPSAETATAPEPKRNALGQLVADVEGEAERAARYAEGWAAHVAEPVAHLLEADGRPVVPFSISAEVSAELDKLKGTVAEHESELQKLADHLQAHFAAHLTEGTIVDNAIALLSRLEL